MVRFGVRHPRIWALLPFVFLAGGVYGLAKLADHYAWGSGTTFLIGALILTVFVMVIGPLAVLPRALKKAAVDSPGSPAVVNLMEALRASVEEAERGRSVSTREGQRPRYRTSR
jgi:hypothetical protein